MIDGSLPGVAAAPHPSTNQTARQRSSMRTARRRFLALGALFLVLSLAYNLATPLFEAPDERDHFSYANWLADGNGLPHLVDDRQSLGEIWQPPLYYAIVAAVIAPFDRSDFPTTAPLSEDWLAGRSHLAHYHTAAEAFPYQTTTLAVRVGRLISTLLGLVTVAATWAIGRRVLPGYALVAAALVALNPQFLFMSAVQNNDNLVIALCSVALWLLVRELTDPAGPHAPETLRPTTGWFIALGLVWGLAALSKLTGASLGAVIGLGLLMMARRQRSWRPLLTGGLITGTTAALVCGWWFWRNWQLYGDPLAWDEMLTLTTGLLRPQPLSLPEVLQYATFLRTTYWASFGYGILAPDSYYWLVYAISAAAVVGLVWRGGRWVRSVGRGRRPSAACVGRWLALALLLVWSLTVFVFLMRWMQQIDQTNQGRLLFPAIAAISVLMAAGLARLDGPRRGLAMVVVAGLGCWAAAMPLVVLRPAFAQPPAWPEAAAIPNPVDIRFGETMTLVGYDLPRLVRPGEPVEIDLYWQTTAPLAQSYSVAVRVLGPDDRAITSIDTLPASGRYPTVVWQTGRPFRDTYLLPPVDNNAVAGLGRLMISVYPGGDTTRPVPVAANGTQVGTEAILGAVKVAPAGEFSATPHQAADTTFDERFQLYGYDLPPQVVPGEPFEITLYWAALQPDGRDYTAFVHLLDDEGNLLAQADSPPQGGRFPTSIWDSGDRLSDTHTATLPEGYRGPVAVAVGLYDPVSGMRLPASDAAGLRLANDTLILTTGLIATPPPAAQDD